MKESYLGILSESIFRIKGDSSLTGCLRLLISPEVEQCYPFVCIRRCILRIKANSLIAGLQGFFIFLEIDKYGTSLHMVEWTSGLNTASSLISFKRLLIVFKFEMCITLL